MSWRSFALFVSVPALLCCWTGQESRLLREYRSAYDRALYPEALSPARELLARAEHAPDPHVRAEAAERTANLELEAGNWDRARALYERALQEAERETFSDPRLLVRGLTGLASCHRKAREYARAELLLQRAIIVSEPFQGVELASALRQLGLVYRDMNRLDDAIPLIRRALDLIEQIHGPDEPLMARAFRELSGIYKAQERYGEAEPLSERALGVATRIWGPARRDIAPYLNDLASIYWYQGRYEAAEQFRENAVAASQSGGGEDDENSLLIRANLALERVRLGRYREAERDYGDLLPRMERVLGITRAETVGLMVQVCELKIVLGSYRQAEELCRRAVDAAPGISAATAFEERVQRVYVGYALRELGVIHSALGRYRDAESALQRARAIMEADGSQPGHELGKVLSSLGVVYLREGNPEKSLPLFEKAQRIARKTFGAGHPEYADGVRLMGFAEAALGHTARAADLQAQALRILRQALGDHHPQVADQMATLAQVCRDPCKAGDRLQLAQQALDIEKDLGGDTIRFWYALAAVHVDRGDHRAAIAALEEAMAALDRSVALQPSAVKPLLRALGWQQALAGNWDGALPIFERMEEVEEGQLGSFLGVVSESRQRSFMEEARDSLDTMVAFQQRWLPRSEEAERLVLRALLRRKARALDATAAQLAAAQEASGENAESLRELRQVRGDLASLLLRGPGSLPSELYGARIRELGQQQEKLESALATQHGRPEAPHVTLEGVGTALPPRSALLELVRYTPPISEAGSRYALYALKDQGQAIRSLDLGLAAPLEKRIEELRKALAAPSGAVAQVARALDRKLLEPLEGFLEDVDRIYVAPDGAFHLVPFPVLIDRRGRYRVERFEWSTLDSGRDLLRASPAVDRAARTPALVLGGAAFDQIPAENTSDVPPSGSRVESPATRSPRSRDFGRQTFMPLPSTVEEVRDVARMLGVSPVLGREASETRIKRAQAPIVLHVATHAFFLRNLPNARLPSEQSSIDTLPVLREQEDPMLRSGLALTGANLRSPSGEDGVLTALEATTLQLAGTELVTLSACDTGVGAIDRGEGVLGLRRAFVLAGARSLLMSLWSVSDAATQRFMVDYYRRLALGEGRAAGLRAVQREFLADPILRDPYYWAPFVLEGEPGPIAGLK